MKKIVYVLSKILSLSGLFFIYCNGGIIDSNGVILPEVIEVFRYYKPLIEEKGSELYQKYNLSKEQIDYILHPDTDPATVSLASLNSIAQLVFLRPAYSERKDAVNDEFLPYTDENVMNLFDKIGDIEDVYPKRNCYKYILINGSTVQNMRYRIETLVTFVESHKINITDSTEIVFLTGERDLFDTEDEAVLLNPFPFQLNSFWQQPSELPKTEDEAAEWIWYQAQLPIAIRNAKITFVSAQKKEVIDNQTGKVIKIRPTTYDTIKKWVDEYAPEPGCCLSISSQPHVYYQEATMNGLFKKMNLLAQGFLVEGVGIGNTNFDAFKKNIAVILDNFARAIYTVVSAQ